MVEIVFKRLHQKMTMISILHVLSSLGCTYSTRILDNCFKESASHDSKIIIRSASTSFSASCALKDLANKKLYSEDWLSFGNVPWQFCKHGSFSLMSVLKRRESAKQISIICNLSVKREPEFLKGAGVSKIDEL